MTAPIRRRDLLRTGAVAGSLALAGCNLLPFGGTRVEDAVSGRVTDVTGQGVPGATVVALGLRRTDTTRNEAVTRKAVEVVGETCTGPDGVFAFDFSDREELRERYRLPDDVVEREVTLLASVEGVEGNRWFGVGRYGPDAFFSTGGRRDVRLDRELLYGPATASIDGNEVTDATVWRRIDASGSDSGCPDRRTADGPSPDYPDQTLLVEVAGHPDQRGPTAQTKDDAARVGSGTLTLQTPQEGLCVQYPDDGVRPQWTQPSGPQDPTAEYVAEEMGVRLRRTGRPFPVGPTVRDAAFTPYTPSDRESVVDQYEARAELVSVGLALLGFADGVGVVATLLGVQSTLMDLETTPESFPTGGSGPFVGGGSPDYDPNAHDLVEAGWFASPIVAQWPYAVLHEVPITFTGKAPVEFAARGVWGTSEGQARLDHGFEVDPTRVTPGVTASGFTDSFEGTESTSTTTATTTEPRTSTAVGSPTGGPESEWVTYADQGNFSWAVVSRETPRGGENALRIRETTGGGTYGSVGWRRPRPGWACSWAVRGLFYAAKAPVDTRYQSHRVLLGGPAAPGGNQVAVDLGLTEPDGSVKPFAIRGTPVETVESTHDPGWTEGEWYHYEVVHDGSGQYGGRLWTEGSSPPSEFQAVSRGDPPTETRGVGKLGINGARGAAFEMEHAFFEFQPARIAGEGTPTDS